MEVSLEAVGYEKKSVLRNMMELYAHDFTEFLDSELNESGLYGYPYLDCFWIEEGRYPYFIRVNEKLAGFVLVRGEMESKPKEAGHSISEFFVLRNYRKQGVGEAAARLAFDTQKGWWEVLQLPTNRPAQEFWKKVIEHFAPQGYEEFSSEEWQGFLFKV